MKNAILIFIVLFFSNKNIEAQTIMKDLIAPENGSLELNDSLYVVENFILNENSVVTFKNGIKKVKVNCKTFKAMNGAEIIGQGKNGELGANGATKHKDGYNGTSGSDGVNFIIVCDTFSFCDFTANLSGGIGGNGGSGIKGKKGKRAHCCKHDASNGDRGGNGGNGGNGGQAGDFIITYKNLISPCNTTINSQNFILKGGVGGNGGAGGLGGDGGNKANKCAPGCNRDGGKRGAKGKRGASGLTPKDKVLVITQS